MAKYTREQLIKLYGEERARAVLVLNDIIKNGGMVERVIAKRLRAQIPYKSCKRCPLADTVLADLRAFVITLSQSFLVKHYAVEIGHYQLRRIDTSKRYDYDNVKLIKIGRTASTSSVSEECNSMDE